MKNQKFAEQDAQWMARTVGTFTQTLNLLRNHRNDWEKFIENALDEGQGTLCHICYGNVSSVPPGLSQRTGLPVPAICGACNGRGLILVEWE